MKKLLKVSAPIFSMAAYAAFVFSAFVINSSANAQAAANYPPPKVDKKSKKTKETIDTQAQSVTTPPSPVVSEPSETEKRIAELLVRLDNYEIQIRELTNRIDLNEQEVETLKTENARLAKLIDDAQAKSSAANTNIVTAQETPTLNPTQGDTKPVESANNLPPANEGASPETGTPEFQGQNVNSIPATSVQDSKQETQALATQTPPTQEAPVLPPPSELIGQAKLQIQKGNFSDAEAKLTLLTENYDTAAEAVEGRWLLGETRFVQGAFAPAAQAYVSYLEKTPDGPRSSDILVRLASSFRQLGDERQRCIALKEYKKRTPNPSPILKARADAEFAQGACP